ncbi:MAG: NAD+ synthase [Pseudomonadota bacterium]
MKIAIAQINPRVGDFDGNCAKIVARSEAAQKDGCDVVVFSELVLSGYPPRDLLEKKDFVAANQAALEYLMGRIRGIGVICGYAAINPAPDGKGLFNAAALFEDGVVLHRAFKRLLPTYDVFDESRYFEPGQDCSVFDYKGCRVGLTICEDAWNDADIFPRPIYHMDPVALMAAAGADLLINVSASPFHVGKRAFRWHMYGALARKYGLPIVYANQVGGNDSILFEGISTAFDSSGRPVAQAADFTEDMVVFDTADAAPAPKQRHPISENDTASMLGALVMGTRDYVTKCGFSQAVIGLSGGIDSALTAGIAAEALGPENVSTVFMPSRYTSADNFTDTRLLAESLGVSYEIIPIDPIFTAFLEHLSPAFDTDAPGITEQNIQARIRGTILMAISNRSGALVLSTGNKSELAVGYCTLYGDMNGGLAVISDVPKTRVYALSRYINRQREVIPQRIIDKAPSAELAPDQTDQDDLPPYDVLDAVLKAYVEEACGVEDILAMGFDPDMVRAVIARVDRNEYKRHQAAPGLKVTAKAFGEGRRYPLAKKIRLTVGG